MELAIGQVIGERYLLEERLGSGAMGVVYRARHVKLGRPFAIKVLHPPLTSNAKLRKRFQREAEIASALRHRNLVSVVDIGETDNLVYLVMELADGVSLQEIMHQAPLSSRRVIDYVRQLCDGLAHAHQAGLVHRDFKPENVIVERDSSGAETLRIIDFGIAILRDPPEERERLTTEGIVLGTPHYMAPEHASGDPVDHRIDLFALGVICFEMMTGQMPFEGDGVDVARANMTLDPPAMTERVPFLEVDPLLETFTRRLMARHRDRRLPSARVAREILDQIEKDRPAAAAALGLEVPTVVMATPVIADRPRQALPVLPVVDEAPGRLRGAPNTLEPVVSTVPAPLPTDRMKPLRRSRRGIAIAAAVAAFVVLCVVAAAINGGDEQSQVASTIETAEESIALRAPPPPAPAPPPPPAIDDEPALEPAPPAPKPTPARRPVIAKTPVTPIAPVRTPTIAAPVKPRAVEVPAGAAPTAAQVAELYGSVGRALGQLQQHKGSEATIDLWPRFRHIRINDAIATSDGRRATHRLLEQLQRDMAARR